MNEELCKHRRYICLLLLLYRRIKRIIKIKKSTSYKKTKILDSSNPSTEATARSWYNLIQEMRFQNDDTFFSYMRMTSTMFDNVLAKVGLKISKMKTNWRSPIPAAARLSMTLRYDVYRVSHNS